MADSIQADNGTLSAVTGLSVSLDVIPCGFCGRPFRPRQRNQAYCRAVCSDRAYNRDHPVRRLDFTPAASELQHEVEGREAAVRLILARLERGEASTRELFAIGGSGTSSRIAELRKELRAIGRDIPPPEKRGRVRWYRITEVG